MSESSIDAVSPIRPGKFNGKGNFSAWKFKTLAYLQSLGLKEVVVFNPFIFQGESTESKGAVTATDADDGSSASSFSSASSSPPAANKRIMALLKKSEKAYAIVLNLLEDELIDLVSHVEAGDAHRVWSVLLETYEVKSTATLCYKLDSLMNIRFNPDTESFDVFKSRFMKLILELKEMNEVVSPAIQRYVLLRSLPPKFEALVQSLKINDKISIEEVYVHIKDYCESDKRRRDIRSDPVRTDNRNQTPGGAERAMVAHGTKECFLCGEEDHFRNDCPLKNRIHCSKCDGTGHVSKFCRVQRDSRELRNVQW